MPCLTQSRLTADAWRCAKRERARETERKRESGASTAESRHRTERTRQDKASRARHRRRHTHLLDGRILLDLDALLLLRGLNVDGDLLRTALLLAFCHLGSVDDSLLSTLARYSVRSLARSLARALAVSPSAPPPPTAPHRPSRTALATTTELRTV